MSCAVIGCFLRGSLFKVREKWLVINPLGWKKASRKLICDAHFRPSDICRGGLRPFIRQTAKPVYFSPISKR